MKIIRRFGNLFIGASLRKIFSVENYKKLFVKNGFGEEEEIIFTDSDRDYKESNFSCRNVFINGEKYYFDKIRYVEYKDELSIQYGNKEIVINKNSNECFHIYIKIDEKFRNVLGFDTYVVNFYIDTVPNDIHREMIDMYNIDEIYSI